MKRRQRKPVLDINGENVADSHRRRWPNERQTQNGSPSNPLANLVGHYNSDSEAEEDHRPRARVLNDKVDDFFKEIQSISHEDLKNNKNMSYPGSFWQECYDEQTGYPYYWHTETNQVTWEIPAELKALHEKNQRETSAAPHGSHIPQWPNVPPNKFPQSQSNIPEGMIPKEVVVRNRNRQAGIVNKPVKSPVRTDCFKVPFKKDDSYDDGKIEMITSFGNDESESEEESEHEEPPKQKSCLKRSLVKPEKSSSHNSESKEPRTQMGPAPPPIAPLNYGPQNKEKLSDRLSQNLQRNKSQQKSDNKDEDDILKRLKNQAKLLQNCGNDEKSNSSREERSHTPPKPSTSDSKNQSKKNIKLSLVPGYEDDSEGEDESNISRKPVKPLFPISEQLPSTDSHSDNVAKKIDTNVGTIRVYDYRNTDSTQSESKIENVSADSHSNVEENSEESLEPKANKFLDSIDAPSKAFQRKKRIAFDVAPTKSKEPEPKEESGSPVQVGSTDPSERRGFGFPKDENGNSPEAEAVKAESDTLPSKKPGIAFVKSTEESTNSNSNSSGSDKNANSVNKPAKEVSEAEKTEVRQLTEPIMEKLRFLSEGSSPASAVQIMAIQIQTLLCAWEAGVLQEVYLRNWLVGTASELTRLEQTAAPPGWECQWDRSHKRYYYRNVSTGEAQWTYPVTDIAGGTEEMDLCTTPPPPEHEETPIIEMSAQAATMSTNSSKNQQEVKPQPPPEPSDPIPPPPPPKISSPSPPPPPRIFAEDLKRGKKRKNSPEHSEHDEESKDAKPSGLEPLPPGVDPPEIAYTLPASALEAGVLYGAQQTNPIYAATLAGAAAAAGIPLLPHHHTALMQGQLVHYNSAYHQHLHNQALVAARLTGQEAVQFMVAAEYARVYENNQVIAKPPVKMTQESSLGSALNSFYSDIASIEHTVETERERIEAIPSPIPQVPHMEVDTAVVEAMKEKKKKKIKTGIGKKQKEMSSMVAKWQRAQKNYKD